MLLSAGEKPKAGSGGKDEERRTTGHCDTRLGGFSLSLSAWSPKCSDVLKIDTWKCKICAAINICGTCIKKQVDMNSSATEHRASKYPTFYSFSRFSFPWQRSRRSEALMFRFPCMSLRDLETKDIYGFTSEQKREDSEDPFPLEHTCPCAIYTLISLIAKK